MDDSLQKEPYLFGYKTWYRSSPTDYIEKQFGVKISVCQYQRMLHALGYSHIRSQTYPSKGYEDTETQVEYKKTTRNRGFKRYYIGVSGGGSLSSSNHHYLWLL